MQSSARSALGGAVVVAAMIALFTAPTGYFTALTFVSTSCMIVLAYLEGLRPGRRVHYLSVIIGLATAAILYGVFYAGGAAIDTFHPFGISSTSESSIYSLIASPSNPLPVQVLMLLFDSAGYESLFRGVLQQRLQGRIGPGAAVLVALLDAGLHIATLNPIWIGATFVTDLGWGLAYYYGKGLQASFTSHLIWDVLIFIVRPVR